MKNIVLVIVLAVQLLVVAAILVVGSQPAEEPGLFLEIDADRVHSIRITAESSEEDEALSVELVRNEESWQLDDGKPANEEKIGNLVEKLAELDSGWPVATTTSTFDRFEVTESNFQKHVQLMDETGELLDEFYMGTSPGFQRVHVRKDGPVFAVALSSYELGEKPSAWLDKELLRPQGDLTRLERIDGYVFTQDENSVWGTDAIEDLDATKVDSFIRRFTNLSVFDIYDGEELAEAVAVFQLSDEIGELQLTVYRDEAEDDWIFESNRVDGLYKVSSYIAEEITNDLVELTINPPDDETELDQEEAGES